MIFAACAEVAWMSNCSETGTLFLFFILMQNQFFVIIFIYYDGELKIYSQRREGWYVLSHNVLYSYVNRFNVGRSNG
jgi:hypothetical protein